ncbi:transglutaminase domain-containing protein [Amycolatopsis sp. 195334CR]|uniref:transglutaminase family protein n=1 Tax=Amycolatopsis sp. 195334CR TaxID=2814588 RepID=UPI001A8D54A3|nr:transglutaminase domain-containing protein [Amycolatopsis sp. 195334CR]MBN6037054.1 transglutaminase domain-containing protein [Amycolatopsis sp. 195334CR]
MKLRVETAGVLLAGAVAGVLFAPVFGFGVLVLPIVVVSLVTFGVAELATRKPSLEPWRPLLVALAGLLGLIESALFPTTAGGLPTGETFGALSAGLTESWRLALQSTWPTRPEAQLFLFVPLAVLAAAVLGIELLHRTRKPLLALLPSLAVLCLSQLYSAAPGSSAVPGALGYAAAAAIALAAGARWSKTAVAAIAALVVVAVGGASAAAVFDPAGRPAYSLKENESAPIPPARVASPLAEIGARLAAPEVPLFRYTANAPVDRWSLVVLDTFDGVNWKPGGEFRRLGVEIPPGPGLTAPVIKREATVSTGGLSGPWLPSQAWPASVTGAEPFVGEGRGTLLGTGAPTGYQLSWWEAQVSGNLPVDTMIDPHAPGGLGGVGAIPPGISELANQATGGQRPSFQSALLLERFLSDNYRAVTGADRPTGHSWPQLRHFLLESKEGTSEQFAAAYVALARIEGIPARLVVGFQSPALPGPDGAFQVRNADVLAWPEVAVAGVGWVALDPTGTAAKSRGGGGLGEVTAQARDRLPDPEALDGPEADEDTSAPTEPEATEDGGLPLALLLAPVLVVPLGWLGGVPLLKRIRRRRRRRAAGNGAVAGAWAEVRDRLRAHRVPVTSGMTVRELADATAKVADPSTVEGVRVLAGAVDAALWSGARTSPELADWAWRAEAEVRKGLSRRPLRDRVRAALDPRGLRS